jgi:uncharacterized protein involved in response to NO
MRFNLFGYGFRPFFLFAGLFACLAVPAWLLMYHAGAMPLPGLPAQLWHGHEMLYGFVFAAVAGFLLTAVPSWTGARGFGGWPLAAVAGVWLAGRIALACAEALPLWLSAGIDLAFLPALAVLLAPPLLRSRNRNTPLLALLLALWLTDAAAWLGFFRQDYALASHSLRVGIDLMLLVVTVIGGRIVPSFTSSALARAGQRVAMAKPAWLERAVIGAMIALVLVDLGWPDGAAAGAIAALAALLQAFRLSGWHSLRTRGEPILWVLHVGYAWLPIGLALKAAWLLGALPWASQWLHALTIGVFATMILAVMTRASLGHTGRPISAGGSLAAAYLLLTLACAVRVFAPSLWPSHYLGALVASGALWIAAFAVYLFIYTPILVLPRADGKPG